VVLLRERTRSGLARGALSAIILTVTTVAPVNAKDCLKPHYTVNHGAVAGCILGHHLAKKRAHIEREKSEHPTQNRE
jgi:hypothetical protein